MVRVSLLSNNSQVLKEKEAHLIAVIPQSAAIERKQVLKKDPPEAYYTMSLFPPDETQANTLLYPAYTLSWVSKPNLTTTC